MAAMVPVGAPKEPLHHRIGLPNPYVACPSLPNAGFPHPPPHLSRKAHLVEQEWKDDNRYELSEKLWRKRNGGSGGFLVTPPQSLHPTA